MATAPDSSKFTSIKQRMHSRKLSTGPVPKKDEMTVAQTRLSLKDFLEEGGHLQAQLPYHYCEYLELVDWSGWAIKADKRG